MYRHSEWTKLTITEIESYLINDIVEKLYVLKFTYPEERTSFVSESFTVLAPWNIQACVQFFFIAVIKYCTQQTQPIHVYYFMFKGEYARITISLTCTSPSNCSGVFRPVPDVVQGSGNITLQVTSIGNTAVLDYEQTKTIKLQVHLCINYTNTKHNTKYFY